MKAVFFLAVLIIFWNCGCPRSAQMSTSEKTMLAKIVEQKFPQQNSVLYNQEKTHALCINKAKKQLDGPIKFFIYSLKSDKIILEDSVPRGSVKWLNESQIEVKTIPGIVKGGESEGNANYGYIFDLNLQKKISMDKADFRK